MKSNPHDVGIQNIAQEYIFKANNILSLLDIAVEIYLRFFKKSPFFFGSPQTTVSESNRTQNGTEPNPLKLEVNRTESLISKPNRKWFGWFG